jgi:hypothetical protein
MGFTLRQISILSAWLVCAFTLTPHPGIRPRLKNVIHADSTRSTSKSLTAEHRGSKDHINRIISTSISVSVTVTESVVAVSISITPSIHPIIVQP